MTPVQIQREADAHAIADVVDAATREFDDEDIALLLKVDQDGRRQAAQMVGRRGPSECTWRRVVAITQQRRAGRRLIEEALADSLACTERRAS